ncbi:MAG: HD domain-containing protein [Simkaniaceae bacterium]|nr:HD domain-containing protein [Simkaniaceae bacterium]
MVKKIFDSVHGFIHFDPLEQRVIASPPVQRLYSIHQLGPAFLVYPGATNKRFEHSIGVMKVATDMYDSITKKESILPQPGSEEHAYWRRIVRMAAICHDIGHLPFSHTAELAILPEGGHEEWTKRLIGSHMIKPLLDEIGPEACESVTSLATGEGRSEIEKILTELITGDSFGADRIDYLLRDARATGLAYGLFDHTQVIESLVVNPETHAIEVDQNGIESVEALLLARYFMHKRLYEYSSVKAFSFHLSRFMQRFYEGKDYLESPEKYISVSDHEVLAELRKSDCDDARRLKKQKERFVAIKLEREVDQSQFLNLGIPKEALGWDITTRTKGSFRLLFPQLKQEESDLSVRFVSSNWLYVDPEYHDQLVKK